MSEYYWRVPYNTNMKLNRSCFFTIWHKNLICKQMHWSKLEYSCNEIKMEKNKIVWDYFSILTGIQTLFGFETWRKKRERDSVVYFDQLSGACSTWKLVELLFSAVFNLICSFQTFFSDFMPKIDKKCLKNEFDMLSLSLSL